MSSSGETILPRGGTNGRRPGAQEGQPPGEVRTSPAPADHRDGDDGPAHLAGAADALLGPSPFVGFGLHDALAGLRAAGQQALRQPRLPQDSVPRTTRELIRIGLGTSRLAPAKSDQRFLDPAWHDNRFLRALMQGHLHLGTGLDRVGGRSCYSRRRRRSRSPGGRRAGRGCWKAGRWRRYSPGCVPMTSCGTTGSTTTSSAATRPPSTSSPGTLTPPGCPSATERSGERVAAPPAVGSERFPAKEPAPGSYIFQ